MKFTCPKEIILAALQVTAKAASAKSTIPALEGLLLELDGDKLTITGYDLDLGIKTSIEVNGVEDGGIIINAKIACDIVRKMPSGIVSFSLSGGNMALISCGNAEFNIMCASTDEYPVVPQVNPETSFTMPQPTLKSMIAQTKFAVAVVDTKPALMGCKFEINNNILSVVAVDGVRIALRQEPVVFENISFIVPIKTLDELVHILSDDPDKNVTICIDKNQISFSIDNNIMISRLLDGEFIPYRNHLAGSREKFVELNCRDMIDMLERSILILSEKNKTPIRCDINSGTITLSCTAALGKMNDSMPVKYNGDPITIGFNAKYMLDTFKACDTDTVKMVVSTSVAPIIVTPVQGDAFTFLVLPMRLK